MTTWNVPPAAVRAMDALRCLPSGPERDHADGRAFFNTSGPVVAADHHCVPPLQRFDIDEVLRLVDAKRYLVLHAPRQTGKTSSLLALRDLLNEGAELRLRQINIRSLP